MKFKGMKVEDVIEVLNKEDIKYDFLEDEKGEGEFYVGGYWGLTTKVMTIEEGVVTYEEDVDEMEW